MIDYPVILARYLMQYANRHGIGPNVKAFEKERIGDEIVMYPKVVDLYVDILIDCDNQRSGDVNRKT